MVRGRIFATDSPLAGGRILRRAALVPSPFPWSGASSAVSEPWLVAWQALLLFWREYRQARQGTGGAMEECRRLFQRFLAAASGRHGLCVLCDDAWPVVEWLGPGWVTLGRSQIARQARDDGRVRIDLADAYFDAVLCSGLGQVAYPLSLVEEIRRVLKGAGQLWVDTPLNGPYGPQAGLPQADYWRITPQGLRVLLDGFDEIRCALYRRGGDCWGSGSYFYGLKPPGEAVARLRCGEGRGGPAQQGCALW